MVLSRPVVVSVMPDAAAAIAAAVVAVAATASTAWAISSGVINYQVSS